MERYELAKKAYAAKGIDTEKALETLKNVEISLHCWQGDDVVGFDSKMAASGGIQTTGNYPGRARTPEELMMDMEKVMSLTPGKLKLNLHACYAISDEEIHRDKLEPKHFAKWLEFAKKHEMGIDFNPTFFSHPMVKDGLTLSSPDDEVRKYWIEHGKCCLRIAEHFAKETGKPCVINYWIPDGYKDIPGDLAGPRKRYMESLDEIFAIGYDKSMVYPTVESKVFGIGVESYTVGNGEFCLGYALSRGITPLFDNGHYHPTEVVSDKISSALLYSDKLALHVTRPVRWDSDHVVLFDDETKAILREVVRGGLDKVFIATDYFDASINRISAWVSGVRNVEKALLFALLMPHEEMKKLQDENRLTELMIVSESLKTMDFGGVWEEYLNRAGMKEDFYPEIKEYEEKVLVNR